MMKRTILAALLCSQLSGCFFVFIPLSAFRAPEVRANSVEVGPAGPCLSTAYSAGSCREGGV